jgi:hypothetical protein
MSRRRARSSASAISGALAAIVASGTLAAAAAPAHADRGEITEQSPYTLEPGELQVGVGEVAMGLFGHALLRRVQVGTYPLFWLPLAAGAGTYNVHGKCELWRDPRLSLALSAGQLLVDFEPIVDQDVTFRITPVEGWAGVKLSDRVRLTSGLVYTNVELRGGTAAGGIDSLGGALGNSNLQWRATAQVGVTEHLTAVFIGRVLAWQKQHGEVTVEDGNDQGTVSNTTEAEGDLFDLGHAWSAGASLHWAWEHFNLRLGVEYGKVSVPTINFVLPTMTVMPEIGLYWRI